MLVFWGEEYPDKNLSEQGGEPTNSAHIRHRIREPNPGHIGGRRVLSPLCHPCSPKKSKPKTNSRASNKTQKKLPGPKLNPKKSCAESPCLKIFQKGLYFVCRWTWPGYTGTTPRELPQIFRLFCTCIPQKIPTYVKALGKILEKFSYPRKPQNQNFHTQKNHPIKLSIT